MSQCLLDFPYGDKTVVVAGAFDLPTTVQSTHMTTNITKLESDHEEADTRIILSLISTSYANYVVMAKDTDIFILLLSHYTLLSGKQIYFVSGSYENRKFYDVSAITMALVDKDIPLQKLALLHALSGCDTTSYPFGIGKAKAWSTYITHSDILLDIDVISP